MLPERDKYHCIAELNIQRARLLSEQSQPKDDPVNWLFLKEGIKRFSFIYKLENPLESDYNSPFSVKIFFLVAEAVKSFKLNHSYNVCRQTNLDTC